MWNYIFQIYHNFISTWIKISCLKCLKRKYRGKFCSNQTFFISLKRRQSMDIESDFSFLIWSYELKIMAKRRAKDQISNSHYSSRQLNPLFFINLIGPITFPRITTSLKEQFHEEKWEKFPYVWKEIIRDKLYPNQKKIIPFKSSQSVDFENDLAFSIWSYELKVMGKRKVGSQISKSPQGKKD